MSLIILLLVFVKLGAWSLELGAWSFFLFLFGQALARLDPEGCYSPVAAFTTPPLAARFKASKYSV